MGAGPKTDQPMDVDASVEEMEVDASMEFESMGGPVKAATRALRDAVHAVVKPDAGKPWRPTTADYEEQRRLRQLSFAPGSRTQRKNKLFVRGCACTAEDARRWRVHFNFCYSASGLAEAAAQHRATSFFAPQVVPMLAAAFFE